jgi:hypothetical protein
MRKFQRAAVVIAAVAGLSAFGAGVSSAHDNGGFGGVTAVASSQANAVAYGGAPQAPYFAPQNGLAYGPQAAAPQVAPQAAPQAAPQSAPQVAPQAAPQVAPQVMPQAAPQAPYVAPQAAGYGQ